MDFPRPALVKQLKLHLSPEGEGFIYLLADQVSGKILRLSKATALAYDKFQRAVHSGPKERAALSQDDARAGFAALSMVRQMRDADRFAARKINPLSMQFPLFDLAPFQPALRGLARRVFGKGGLAVFLLLVLTAAVLGVRNDWAIVQEFRNIFSLEALLTFGLLAPVLKVFHEFGHVLAATRYRVHLRKAGLNLIGFYPIPYVDCSEADLTASRRQRMIISGAGIFADVGMGLAAFILWHLVGDAMVQKILGRIFVFCTLNSLLLNANPLMRMDGYFILSDLISRRNLGTEASAALKGARRKLLEPGVQVATPPGLVAFGLASMTYRLTVLFGLVWAILPKFLGLGMILGVWGGWLMFVAPAFARTRTPPAATAPAETETRPRRRRLLRRGLLAAGAVGLAFLPVSSRAVVELSPDLLTGYAVTTTRPGFVSTLPPSDMVLQRGTEVLRLVNPKFDDAITLADMALEEALLSEQIGLGKGAAETEAGVQRVRNAEAMRALALAEKAALVLTAPEQGRFILTRTLHPGGYLPAGTVIGALLPVAGMAQLQGKFPETRVDAFEAGVVGAEVYDGATYRDLSPERLSLAETLRTDSKTMQRSFTLRVALDTPAAELPGPAQQIRLKFQPMPVWRHVAHWVTTKISQFRDAEMAERTKRIDSN